MGIRDRIKEFRRVRAGDLKPHEHNPRLHPERQRTAMQAALNEIGYADVLVVQQRPDGSLRILDGHLRADLDPDQQVPCVIVDLDDVEASKFIATHDPLAGMAEYDQDLLKKLMEGIEFKAPQLGGIIADLLIPLAVQSANKEPIPDPLDGPAISQPGDVW
ncbi:hypothetical protein LCGC14_2211590, partial [marine sediment metagenome]